MIAQSSRRTDVAFANDTWTIQVESMLDITQHSGAYGHVVHASAAPLAIIVVGASGATLRFDLAKHTDTDFESSSD